MTLRRLSGSDAVFLAAESPASPLHMMAVMVLDPSEVEGGYDFARFRDFFARRLHLVPPLRRRLVEVPLGLGRPYWIEDPEIDLDRHLHRAALPEPAGVRELAALAAEMDERPLRRDRPLWEMRVVENFEGGRVALLAKLHHAMMDGIAGVQFMASLLSRTPETTAPPRVAPGPVSRVPGPLELLARAVPDLVARPFQIARLSQATLRASLAQRLAGEAVEPPLEVPDSCLNRAAGTERRIAFGSLSLESVRDVGHAYDATVNDVVLALVGGVLRRRLLDAGDLPGESLVAGVPVSTHRGGDELANAISILFASLATDLADPAMRLIAIRDGARRAKLRQRSTPIVLEEWADVPLPLEIGLLIRLYTGFQGVRDRSRLCNVTVSNVPGPPVPLYLAGLRIVGLHPLGPVFDGMNLNITVISREDALDFGLVAGREPAGDLWSLAAALSAELDELAKGAPRR